MGIDSFKYNIHGQVQTGFDNSIDHSFYGHWRNHEYQANCQLENMTEEEYQLYLKNKEEQNKYNPNAFDPENLPF